MLGSSSLHNSVRTFELNCIRELTTTEDCFPGDKDFDVSEYLGRAWSMVPEGQIYHVKLILQHKLPLIFLQQFPDKSKIIQPLRSIYAYIENSDANVAQR